jgi:hypothetical protein
MAASAVQSRVVNIAKNIGKFGKFGTGGYIFLSRFKMR